MRPDRTDCSPRVLKKASGDVRSLFCRMCDIDLRGSLTCFVLWLAVLKLACPWRTRAYIFCTEGGVGVPLLR